MTTPPFRLLAPIFGAVLLTLAGCPGSAPLVRGQVVGIADNVQRRESLAWGDPSEILGPGPADAQGHRWWQLRYGNDAAGRPRILIVDDGTGWGRLPPAGYPVRIQVDGQVPLTDTPPIVVEGSQVVLVAPWLTRTPEDEALLEREAPRLNALAGTTGLYPLFSVRRDRSGRSALVYGWQGDRGIARNDAVTSWIDLRTTYKTATWVELLP